MTTDATPEQIKFAVQTQLARQSFRQFVTLTKTNYKWNWHHVALARALQSFAEGKIKRLMVNMPPRHGKSELTSRQLPAWLLGRNPDAHIISSAHTAPLTRRFNRAVQRIMDSWRYHEIFPDTKLAGDPTLKDQQSGTWVRSGSLFEIVGRDGSYLSAPVNSGIAGEGLNFGLIDDPIKNRKQAYSKVIRDAMWEWYVEDFLTRMDDKDAGILVTMTRWHHDDLAGRLLRQEGEKWTVINFPAIRQEHHESQLDVRELGEALWPQKYPLSYLHDRPGGIESTGFRALFQGDPPFGTGNVFHTELFKRFWLKGDMLVFENGTHIRLDDCVIFATCDLATSTKQTGDYTVVCVWALATNGMICLLDMERRHYGGDDIIPFIVKTCARWNCHEIHVEKMGFQLNLIQTAIKKGHAFRMLKPDKDKLSRCHAILAEMEMGMVAIRSDAQWASVVDSELSVFPSSDALAHDDIVDCFAYAGILAGDRKVVSGIPRTIYEVESESDDVVLTDWD